MTSGADISDLYHEFTDALTEVLAENSVGPARRGRLASSLLSREPRRMLSCLSVREHPGKSAGMSATKILKVRVDRERCQGHARCFALAPELFELDQFGNGRERGDGTVALEDKARLAQANCPEMAVEIIEE